jgi:hypothetical protein
MYQSIYYDFTDYTYYLRDDKAGWKTFQHKPTYWKRAEEWDEGAQPILTGGWAVPTTKFKKDDKGQPSSENLTHKEVIEKKRGFINKILKIFKDN